MINSTGYSRLIFQENYKNKIDELIKIKPTITSKPVQEEPNYSLLDLSIGYKLEALEKIIPYQLNAKNGSEVTKKKILSGYDESKLKFLALEGTAYFTTHTLVIVANDDYLPITLFTFNFYTRSEKLLEKSSFIRFSDNPSIDSELDYIAERNEFLSNWGEKSSIMFIDGPFIGGNVTTYNLKLINNLLQKNIIPIFFVKNSNSNLVVDNINELKKRYNSDLHWLYHFLDNGTRSNIFKYTDEHNSENSKIFFYIKSLKNISPQRVEMHPKVFALIEDQFPEIINLIYYLLLVHGDKSNLQIRPIAIAEMFSREVMQLTNFTKIFSNIQFVPTMNQTRFGGI